MNTMERGNVSGLGEVSGFIYIILFYLKSSVAHQYRFYSTSVGKGLFAPKTLPAIPPAWPLKRFSLIAALFVGLPGACVLYLIVSVLSFPVQLASRRSSPSSSPDQRYGALSTFAWVHRISHRLASSVLEPAKWPLFDSYLPKRHITVRLTPQLPFQINLSHQASPDPMSSISNTLRSAVVARHRLVRWGVCHCQIASWNPMPSIPPVAFPESFHRSMARHHS